MNAFSGWLIYWSQNHEFGPFCKRTHFRKSVIKIVKWLRLSPEKTFWGQLDTAGSEFHIETGHTRRFPTFSGANRPRTCSKSAQIRSDPDNFANSHPFLPKPRVEFRPKASKINLFGQFRCKIRMQRYLIDPKMSSPGLSGAELGFLWPLFERYTPSKMVKNCKFGINK